jgi:ATP-binding cassette subfamily B protein
MWKRYPTVRQVDESDCGAAALATICLFHRLPVGLQKMRDMTGTDREGTNLLGLVEAAERLGLSAKAVKGPYEALMGIPLPAVAHIRRADGLGHFVVLFRADKRGVVISDPAEGIKRIEIERFRQQWTGHLLIVTPKPLHQSAGGDSAARSPWRRFWNLMQQHCGILVEAGICALLMMLLGMSTSYFVRHLVDSVLVRGDSRLLNAFGIAMLAIALFQSLFAVVRQYLLAHISRKIDLGLISSYTQHVLMLPMSFFEMRRVGEILSRVTDASKVREAISGVTLTALVDGILVVFSSIVLWMYDPRLAAVASLFAPLMLILIVGHHPAARYRAGRSMEHASQLSSHLAEDIAGVETIKAYGARRLRNDQADCHLTQLVKSIFSMQILNLSMSSLSGLVGVAAGVVILWYGGHRVAAGALTIGELMFFHTLLGSLLEPMKRLASVNLQLQDALVAMDRLFQIMDLDTEQNCEGKSKFPGVSSEIRLRHVSFRYGCRQEVLRGIDLTIPAGSTVAFVGESGCGKSTLLKLLMRYYDPTDGSIAIDGVDVRDFDVESLRRRIGLVSQEPFVFNGTVRENIALGRPDAPMNEVIEAARAAGLEEAIAELPDRFETVIGERGANVSGGQRQRLAIARALLCRPEIMLFDEATSHLDTQTEQAIQRNLREAFDGKTVLIVAHRLSTICDADTIYVMDKGRIIEHGTHDQLLAAGGRYAALWRSQTGRDRDTLASYAPANRCNGNTTAWIASREN